MSSKVLMLAFAATAALAFPSAAAAQTRAVLSGVVHDRGGEPVPGVVLTIVDPGTDVTRVVVTDHRGGYFVDRLHYGTEYAVEVSHPRFRKSRMRASANEGELPIHVTLAPRRTRLAAVARFPMRVLSLGWIGP